MRRLSWKLNVIGGLSVLSFVLAGLVIFELLSAENRRSIAFQYLLVGALLGAFFLLLGGFTALRAGFGRLRRRASGSEVTEPEGLNRAPTSAPIVGSGVERIDGTQRHQVVDSREETRRSTDGMDGGTGDADHRDSDVDGPPARQVVDEVRFVEEPRSRTQAVDIVPLGLAVSGPVTRWSLVDQVMTTVRRHEDQLVDLFIDEGLLTIEGPITDRDVRAMVWVAVSSIELADRLLNTAADQTPAELGDSPLARRSLGASFASELSQQVNTGPDP